MDELYETQSDFRASLRRIEDKLSGLSCDMTSLKADITCLKTEVNIIKIDMKSTELKNDSRYGRISAKFADLRAGMDEGLEKLCAKWLQHYLESSDPNAEVLDRYRFVAPNGKEKEIGVICMEPLIILEYTSFLKESEMNKIKNLVVVKELLEQKLERQCKAPQFSPL